MSDDVAATDQSAQNGPATSAPTEVLEAAHSVSPDVPEHTTPGEIRQLREEAKRRRLAQRAAEAERDELRTRLDQHERREVERQIADRVQDPSDFWLTTSPTDLRDPDTGELDGERVAERVEALLTERPHWRKTERPDFSSGVRAPIKRSATIGEAFKRSLTGR